MADSEPDVLSALEAGLDQKEKELAEEQSRKSTSPHEVHDPIELDEVHGNGKIISGADSGKAVGQLQRKRTLYEEEDDEDEDDLTSRRQRKRSRSNDTEPELSIIESRLARDKTSSDAGDYEDTAAVEITVAKTNGAKEKAATPEAMDESNKVTSPKGKRNRSQFQDDEEPVSLSIADAPIQTNEGSKTPSARDAKRQNRDDDTKKIESDTEKLEITKVSHPAPSLHFQSDPYSSHQLLPLQIPPPHPLLQVFLVANCQRMPKSPLQSPHSRLLASAPSLNRPRRRFLRLQKKHRVPQSLNPRSRRNQRRIRKMLRPMRHSRLPASANWHNPRILLLAL